MSPRNAEADYLPLFDALDKDEPTSSVESESDSLDRVNRMLDDAAEETDTGRPREDAPTPKRCKAS